MKYLIILFLSGCYCEVISEQPSFCQRLIDHGCANAQCDSQGEPTPERCDMEQVEACVSAIEAVDCWEAGGIAVSPLCTEACE